MNRNKKQVLTVLCVGLVSVGALTFTARPLASKSTAVTRKPPTAPNNTPTAVPLGTRESPSPASAPEHVIYRQFFRHLVALNERATQAERQGKDGKKLRSHYKDKTGLAEEHSRILDKVADDYEREVRQLDAKAKKIIDQAHARYPKGVVPAGEQLPPPPPELKDLQRQRDYSVMRARHRLQTSLGEHGFRQLDDFLKLKFAPNVRPVPVTPRSDIGRPGGGSKK